MSISSGVYLEAYNRMQFRMCEQLNGDVDKFLKQPEEYRNRFIYSFVMSLAISHRKHQMDYELVTLDFQAYELAMEFLGTLTPVEFERMFPIIKEYDGKRWGVKDYFYCKDKLKLLPQDEPIRKNKKMSSFLWDCHNRAIRRLTVNYMQVIDDLLMLQGKPSMIEEFFSDNDIPVYRKVTGVNGKAYLQNSKTGQFNPIQKPLPSYMRVVK